MLSVQMQGYLLEDPTEVEANDLTAPPPCCVARINWGARVDSPADIEKTTIRIFTNGMTAKRLLKARKGDRIEAVGELMQLWMVGDGGYYIHNPKMLAIFSLRKRGEHKVQVAL